MGGLASAPPRPASAKFAPVPANSMSLADRLSMQMPRIASLSRKRKKRICILGLDSAGKSTILNLLLKKDIGTVTVPTEGFNAESLKYKGNDGRLELTLWDLGGQDKLRNMWKHYLVGSDGIIFVVDATDDARLELCGQELATCLQDESLAEARILVLANKQDQTGAKSEQQVADKMGLSEPDGRTFALLGKRPFHIFGTSAVKNSESVFIAVDWLCGAMKKP